MKKSEFRTPLIQSALLLGGVVILFAAVGSSGATSTGGGILALFAGIGNTILFAIGLSLGIGICIAVLVGIFLGAVAMVSPEQASGMYADLKKKFSHGVLTCKEAWTCNASTDQVAGVTEEEHTFLKQEVLELQDKNKNLLDRSKTFENDTKSLFSEIDSLKSSNGTLEMKLEELTLTLIALQESEQNIKGGIAELNAKIPSGPDQSLVEQIKQLESLQNGIRSELDNLIETLGGVEPSTQESPASGIFSYIENTEDQNSFIKSTEEAVAEKMTYAQIDEHLAKKLSKDLYQIIKDHPSLTKNYIRDLRQD